MNELKIKSYDSTEQRKISQYGKNISLNVGNFLLMFTIVIECIGLVLIGRLRMFESHTHYSLYFILYNKVKEKP